MSLANCSVPIAWPRTFDHAMGTEQFAKLMGQSLDQFLRSEEHTSELQSRSDLVCRLLLDKKTLRLLGVLLRHPVARSRPHVPRPTGHVLRQHLRAAPPGGLPRVPPPRPLPLHIASPRQAA